jgi:alkylated DNA repair dioxygenase AlkB
MSRTRRKEEINKIDIKLNNGNILFLNSNLQYEFKHGIPKKLDEHGKRISISFRKYK